MDTIDRMLKLIRRLVFSYSGCLLIFLVGCTTSEYPTGYCAGLDLGQLAATHASQGMNQKSEELVSRCSAQGVDLDMRVYMDSYEHSRALFCNNTDAFQYGYEGEHYEGICTEPESFSQEYGLGKTIFDLRYELWKLENKLEQSQREIDVYLSSANYAGSSRVDRIRKDIREYKAERGRLRILLYESEDEAKALGFNLE